jgi:FkbM family methyltransferase
MIKKIIRDNVFVNPIMRSCIRFLHNRFDFFGSVVNKYRVFGVVKIEVNAIEFKIYAEADDFIANELYYNIGYEAAEFKLIKYLLLNSKTFVDVGANTGIFTIYSALVNRNVSVYSFEPHPFNFKRLCKNIQLNNLGNITPLSVAAGASEGFIKFTLPNDLSISATASANEGFTRNFHRVEFKEIQVKQVSLDKTLSKLNLTSSDLIKIDVEYYELEVLKGAATILKEKRPMLILEILNYNSLVKQFPQMDGKINSNYGNEILTFLKGMGYHGYAIQDESISFIDALEDHQNRNFLFMPYKLNNAIVAFDTILN